MKPVREATGVPFAIRFAPPLLGLTLLAALTGACAADPPATGPGSPLTPASPSTSTTATTSTTSTIPPERTTPASSTAPAGTLVLRAGGLGAIDFGAPGERTVRQIEEILGPAARGTGPAEVCPAYRSATWPARGVNLYLDPEGAFAGWDVRDPGAGATAEGVTVGTDVATLRRTYGPRLTVGESTLGTEFSVAEPPTGERSLDGLVDRPGDDGRVTGLWSGFTCAAR